MLLLHTCFVCVCQFDSGTCTCTHAHDTNLVHVLEMETKYSYTLSHVTEHFIIHNYMCTGRSLTLLVYILPFAYV